MARSLSLLLAFVMAGCSTKGIAPPEPTRDPATDVPAEWEQVQTPDGAMSLLGPAEWAVGTATGFIRLAPSEATLTAVNLPEEPRVTFVIVTGPGRAQDFGMEGWSMGEVYATFAMYPDSRVGAPSEVDGPPWPGLEGRRSTPAGGDSRLNVLRIDEQTFLVVQAYAPAGQGETLEPLLGAMIASLRFERPDQ